MTFFMVSDWTAFRRLTVAAIAIATVLTVGQAQAEKNSLSLAQQFGDCAGQYEALSEWLQSNGQPAQAQLMLGFARGAQVASAILFEESGWKGQEASTSQHDNALVQAKSLLERADAYIF